MLVLTKFCFIVLFLLSSALGAKILGIVHMPSYSHFQLGDRIFRELAQKGHEVTVISPYELKDPIKNLKHVVLTGFAEEIEAQTKDFLNSSNFDMSMAMKLLWFEPHAVGITETVIGHGNVQNLLKSNEKFDLIIYENFLNEAFSGFSYHYKAPYVILSTIGPSRWTNTKMGNSHNPAYMPDPYSNYSSNMNFYERLQNWLMYLGAQAVTHLYSYPRHNQLVQKHFPGAPHLDELVYNVSLMLLNSHVSIGAPVPLLPNMIEIGGYHVKPPKELPSDLKNYLDNAKEGVVYFSMGSIMKSSYMPEEKRDAILTALGKLKEKVLWKWEDDTLPGQPANVKLGKWLPQQDILAHPNVKLFITHGGLLSTIEAIYHGVPVLGIPVYGDQMLNIGQAKNAGYGLGLRYSDLTEAKLTEALNEMLSNKQFAENAKLRSKHMNDQLTKPLERAIYWIEYVIRHRGAPHLRTAALNLHWHQYLLLDVMVAVLVIIAIALFVLFKIAKLLSCNCRKSESRAKKEN